MWREVWDSIQARIRLLASLLADGLFVLLWSYVANFVFRYLPSQLPFVDREALDRFMAISVNLLLIGAVAHGIYDLYCLLLRLWRDAKKKWREPDEE